MAQRAIDGFARSLPPPAVLRRLAPHFGDRAVRDLGVLAGAADGETLASLAPAIAASRRAVGLSVLRGLQPPAGTPAARAVALGLLALGDGSRTGTLARALAATEPSVRREVARGLSTMRHVRPVEMMLDLLEDEDEEVRYWAALGLSPRRFRRAQRTLEALVEKGSPAIRGRAARALLDHYPAPRVEVLERMPAAEGARGLVAAAVHGRSRVVGRLDREAAGADPIRRAGAFAALAHVETSAAVRTVAARAERRVGAAVRAPAVMAGALLGDEAAVAALSELSAPEAAVAVDVLEAYAAAGDEGAVALEHAEKLASWLERAGRDGRLDARQLDRGLEALESIEPQAAIGLAERRLAGAATDGRAVRVALAVLGRSGELEALPMVAEVARKARDASTRAEAWRAAARICER